MTVRELYLKLQEANLICPSAPVYVDGEAEIYAVTYEKDDDDMFVLLIDTAIP